MVADAGVPVTSKVALGSVLPTPTWAEAKLVANTAIAKIIFFIFIDLLIKNMMGY